MDTVRFTFEIDCMYLSPYLQSDVVKTSFTPYIPVHPIASQVHKRHNLFQGAFLVFPLFWTPLDAPYLFTGKQVMKYLILQWLNALVAFFLFGWNLYIKYVLICCQVPNTLLPLIFSLMWIKIFFTHERVNIYHCMENTTWSTNVISSA